MGHDNGPGHTSFTAGGRCGCVGRDGNAKGPFPTAVRMRCSYLVRALNPTRRRWSCSLTDCNTASSGGNPEMPFRPLAFRMEPPREKGNVCCIPSRVMDSMYSSKNAVRREGRSNWSASPQGCGPSDATRLSSLENSPNGKRRMSVGYSVTTIDRVLSMGCGYVNKLFMQTF